MRTDRVAWLIVGFAFAYFSGHVVVAAARPDPVTTRIVSAAVVPSTATPTAVTALPVPSVTLPTASPAAAHAKGASPARTGTTASSASVCRSSWYGAENGQTVTASGARNDPTTLHAAHRTLPFGTRVLVSYAGRSVVVVIDDRGPQARTGRTLDLSKAAFQRLAPLSVGVIDARCEVVS